MTRSAFVLVLLSFFSPLVAQVPPPLAPYELTALHAVKAWDIEYAYHWTASASGSGTLQPGQGYSYSGKAIDSWTHSRWEDLGFTLNATIAGKYGQSDCGPARDSCLIKYSSPAVIGSIAETFDRYDEAHFPECCLDSLGGVTDGTQSLRQLMNISGSKVLNGTGTNWIRGKLSIDYSVNPPLAFGEFTSPTIGGTMSLQYSGWYRSDTQTTNGGSIYYVGVIPYDSVVTRVTVENGRFVIRGSHTTNSSYVPCPGIWLQCDSNTRRGSGTTAETLDWVVTSRPDSSILVTRPLAGDLFVSGQVDTIRWHTDAAGTVRILYSLDNGATFTAVAEGIPASARKYAWRVPDTLSPKCRIRVESMDDTTNNGLSATFRMKPYVLTWNTILGDYYAYDPALDAWGFRNTAADMWPASWTARFNYQGTDPFTGSGYSTWQGGGIFSNTAPTAHPDWESWVRAFTVNACYVSTYFGIYSPTALARWGAAAGSWGGSCFGIAIANAIVFRNMGNFFGRYPAFPGFVAPASVTSDTNVIPVVNELFSHQFGDPHRQIRQTLLLRTPTQTVNDMKEMFASESAPVRTLSILNNGAGGGGHAILAWKLRQDTSFPNLYYVSVYDNSWADSTNAQIVIDTALNGGNGGWSYTLWPGWGGSKWIYLRDPAIDYLQVPSFPKDDPDGRSSPFVIEANALEIGQAGAGSVEIRDSLGNVTGFVGGIVAAEIPGSYPLVVEDGSEHAPYGYGMDLAPVTVSLTGDAGSDGAAAYFFTGNRTFTASRSGVQPSDTDMFSFDGGLAAFNPSPGGRTYDFMAIVNESAQEKAFRLDSVSFSPGDSLRIGIAGPDGMKIVSRAGAGRTYDVEVALYADTGLVRFTAADVPIGTGTVSHTIAPDWSNLAGSVLKVLVDQGDDGSIEDTLGLSNEVTGLDDDVIRDLPKRYALHRNYPNPFNPDTKIAFELPRSGYVILSVHDVLGREVARLVDGARGPGRHEVTFDAGALPGGVYFYTLRAGEYSATEKMVLMK